MRIAVILSLAGLLACQGPDPPPAPESPDFTVAAEVLTPSDLEKRTLDVDIAIKELEIEVERIEEEWEPDATYAVARMHAEDLDAVERRVRELYASLREGQQNETSEFERFRIRAERRLRGLDHRVDVLESAVAHAALQPEERASPEAMPNILPSVF